MGILGVVSVVFNESGQYCERSDLKEVTYILICKKRFLDQWHIHVEQGYCIFMVAILISQTKGSF